MWRSGLTDTDVPKSVLEPVFRVGGNGNCLAFSVIQRLWIRANTQSVPHTPGEIRTIERDVLGERELCCCYLIFIREALVAPAVVLLHMVGQLGDEDRCQGHGRSS